MEWVGHINEIIFTRINDCNDFCFGRHRYLHVQLYQISTNYNHNAHSTYSLYTIMIRNMIDTHSWGTYILFNVYYVGTSVNTEHTKRKWYAYRHMWACGITSMYMTLSYYKIQHRCFWKYWTNFWAKITNKS